MPAQIAVDSTLENDWEVCVAWLCSEAKTYFIIGMGFGYVCVHHGTEQLNIKSLLASLWQLGVIAWSMKEF